MTTDSLIRIGTHSGSFHADDVLAVAILTTIFPNHQIIRSRDNDILEDLDILVDVGDCYDHTWRRYDHHMHNPPKDRFDHLLSSAGLIWRHYSKIYLNAIKMPKDFTFKGQTIDLITAVEKNIRTHWIHPIDRADNGAAQGPTAISELVRAMRPTDPEKSRQRFDELFLEAVSMVSFVFKRACFHSADHVILKTKANIEEQILLCDGKIIVSQYPFHSYKAVSPTSAHFVIHPSQEYEGSEEYFVVRLITDVDTKLPKTIIPSEVLGTRRDTIEKVLGVKGVAYVHHGGHQFLADTKEDAIRLCMKLLGETV